MLASATKNGSTCIRCAYRFRLQSLQQSRLRSTSTHRLDLDRRNADDIPIRYHATARDFDTKRDNIRRDSTTKVTGVVRRLAPRTELSRWGLDDESQNRKAEDRFRYALMEALDTSEAELQDAPIVDQLVKESKGLEGDRAKVFQKVWKTFRNGLLGAGGKISRQAHRARRIDIEYGAMKDDLALAHRTRGKNGLEDRIKYAFYGHVTGARFTPSDLKHQKALADLRYPNEWFPATRRRPREVHLHVGPTNSGKTYHALQRLEQASSGVYAGPLRLLAHEVYSRMNAKGIACRLVTGEERRAEAGYEEKLNSEQDADQELPGETGPLLTSCTVEMVPLNQKLDVAVIDEIQMLGDSERGWAWTNALLGVQAKEVHLCGEERTVPLIKEICATVGDKLHIHHYKRLSPLQVSNKSLNGDLSLLRKGDCIVSFSVVGIHALQKEIQKRTGRKVAIVYGSLPPETRAQQARLFNDPDNDYDFLVASDAVGMGLNLAIKRMIFESSSKFDGVARAPLHVAAIKQIGGRAGRFRTAAQGADPAATAEALEEAREAQLSIDPKQTYKMNRDGDVPDNIGLVTTLEDFDYPAVAAAMRSEPEPITTAGIFPPTPVLERFASYFPPGTPFSYILTRLHETSQMHHRFHLCALKDQVWVADLIEQVTDLTINDRNIICACPASKSDIKLWRQLMPALARCISTQSGGDLLDIEEMPLDTLDEPEQISKEYLRKLEQLHKGLVGYLWLSYRFAGVFMTRKLATHVKGLVEEKIEHVLANLNLDAANRRAILQKKDIAIREQKLREEAAVQQALLEQATPREEADGVDENNKFGAEEIVDEASEEEPQSEDIKHSSSIDIDELLTDSLEPREIAASPDQFVGEEDVVFEEPDEVILENDLDRSEDIDEVNGDSGNEDIGRDMPLQPAAAKMPLSEQAGSEHDFDKKETAEQPELVTPAEPRAASGAS